MNRKQKDLYQILPFVIMGICMIGTCVIGVRIFARKVLIGKLGIENYVTCALADYNWGDRLERTLPSEPERETVQTVQALSVRLTELEEILEGAPEAADAEEPAADAPEQGSIAGLAEKWSDKVLAAEDDITKYCNDKFMFYRQLRQISSGFDALAGWELAYARTGGSTYTLKTGYDYQAVEAADLTSYADTLIRNRDIAKQAGTDFLYVQYPYRVDRENSQVPWGASSFENENADDMLELLRTAGVDVLDLRSGLPALGWQNDSGFYETDGHWTTRSGFLSAGIVAEYLNEQYAYAFDERFFDEANYSVERYSVNSYAVKEEVEIFIPQFETDFCVADAYRSAAYEGTFTDACFDMAKVDTEEYSSVLTAYSSSRIRNSYLFEYQNRKTTNNDKRILIASDSFSWHLIPYLALDVEYIDYVYKMTPAQLEYYIAKLQPDMVIVMDKPYY